MIRALLHKIVAIPQVYDLVQKIGSSEQMDQRLKHKIAGLSNIDRIVDIGGGTGIHKDVAVGGLYVCLDIDEVKLAGYRQKDRSGVAVLGDATQCPIATGSIDLVICTSISHHIPDNLIRNLFAESIRVLKPTGTLLFSDGVRNDKRLRSRVLWKYDRGEHPRTKEQLKSLIQSEGQIIDWDEVEWPLHQCVICLVRRNDP